MLFSSIIFLYYFLPILILIYYIVPSNYRNFVLLIFSLFFYFYGEPRYIVILLLSCLINYYASKLIEKYEQASKAILIITILYNVGQLLYFKYTDFFIANVNSLLNVSISLTNIVMPIGISFFTFQALGYVIDVYRKEVSASDSLLNFTMYISFFPQLVAGPIVRYRDIDKQINDRKTNMDSFALGVKRFSIGLAKKVLIANVLGELVTSLTTIPTKTVTSYWLVSIGFTLQIYFDFSGYSDMAIGLAHMFGFKFLENFNYPFIAQSISDFWRRWHISLSTFFKDNVYIPLGGSRVNMIKNIRNIFIVWFLTGFWHGASWNFIIWGLYFAFLLIIEKNFLLTKLEKTKIFKHVYTLFLVIISFTIFNANSLTEVIISLKSMFGLNNLSLINNDTIYYLRSYGFILVLASIASTPILKKSLQSTKIRKLFDVFELVYYPALLIIVTAYLIDSSFNPFLYFRF